MRCIKKQQPDCTIHFITKKAFAGLLTHNPYIDNVIAIEKEITEVVQELKLERYDFIVDLHRNLRTARLKQKLKRRSASFPKLNKEKFLLTQLKINRLPDVHIVERYFKAVEKIGVVNDGKGLDYFIPPSVSEKMADWKLKSPFIAIAIGAQFATKKLPNAQLVKLIEKIELPVVLLGGKTDVTNAAEIVANVQKKVVNLCGQLSLDESAAVVEAAHKVVTHDTGLMHIAAALKKEIISIWGNTVPAFGMYPYLPQGNASFTVNEVQLKCRPCSKIGHANCPKKHFNCMQQQDITAIAHQINR